MISKAKECYIVSKASGNKLHDKPYNVERVKISKTDDNTFVYNFIDIGSIKEDIKGVMTNYKDTILFFEIGVFADIYSYLRSHLQL